MRPSNWRDSNSPAIDSFAQRGQDALQLSPLKHSEKYTLTRAQSTQHKLYEIMRAKDAATFLLEANKAASAPKPAGAINTPADPPATRDRAPEDTARGSELLLSARVAERVSEIELLPAFGVKTDDDAVGCGLLCDGAPPLVGGVSVEV